MKRKFKLASLFTVLALFCSFSFVQAQGDPGDDPDPGAGTNIPFDGGLSLIVAAGIAYAAKKGYNKKNKQKNSTE